MKLVLCASVLLAVTCGCSPGAPISASANASLDFTPGEGIRVMPLTEGVQPLLSVPLGTHMDYQGGPVIANAKVVQVLYGAGTYAPEVTANLGVFYQQLLNSPIQDWLSEYSTTVPTKDGRPGTQQVIGRGSFGSQIQISPSGANLGPILSDTQLQAELEAQMTSGALPTPDSNTYYSVSLPSGVRVSVGGGTSCTHGGFCAYHGSFGHGGARAYYGVLPDMAAGSGCELGCGTTSVPFDNQTMVASHELMEALTDADVGANNLAWYDGASAEVGDMCIQQRGTFTGTDGVLYTAQKIFSNQVGDCILTKGLSTADFTLALSPSSLALGAGATAVLLVATTSVAGTGHVLTLGISGLPGGVTAAFNPSTVTAGGGSVLTLTADASAAPSTAELTLAATDASGTLTAPLGLAVTKAGTVNNVVNGDFERGDTTGWAVSGVARAFAQSHTGNYAVMLGTTIATSGDSSVVQNIVVPPGASSLTFWYWMNCRDTVPNDWATATLTDTATGGVQTLLAPTCENLGWVQVTAPVVAGRTYALALINHDDGSWGDPTYSLFDDVSVK